MLLHTFCHLPSIGARKERAFWDRGVLTWDHIDPSRLSPRRRDEILARIDESNRALESNDGAFFARCLPPSEDWRLFRHFRDLPAGVAYLDIETTGMQGHPGDHVTTIALYDGATVRTYVHGRNLDEFPTDVAAYGLLVTYNGKCFDVPYLRQAFGRRCPLPQPHIDLRYTLARLGFKGGLKGCEKALGLSRAETDGLDGYFAVLLWRDYCRTGNERTLDTLLAYNVDDVLHLECLIHLAWNRLVGETPFGDALQLPEAPPRPNPFLADLDTIERLRPVAYGNPWA